MTAAPLTAEQRIVADRVIAAVCAARGNVAPAEVPGSQKYRRLVEARWLTTFVLYHDCGFTLEESGDAIGRDHSTVSHGLERMSSLTMKDSELARSLAGARTILSRDAPAPGFPLALAELLNAADRAERSVIEHLPVLAGSRLLRAIRELREAAIRGDK